jgi:hypothetical protein
VTAALVHSGVLMTGYEHREAAIAETVIGGVLLAGLTLSVLRPDPTRGIGLAVQAFALLGTLVGVTMVVIGVGPQTAPDIVYHIGILIVLAFGLAATARARSDHMRPV